MFEATINAGILKRAVSALRRIDNETIRSWSGEAVIEIGGNGVHCERTDATNTIMVVVAVPSTAFAAYNVAEMRIGINLNRMDSVLEGAKEGDKITIDGDNTSLRVVRGWHRHTVGLLDPDLIRKSPKRPKLAHTASVVLTGAEFKGIMAAARSMSEIVMIETRTERMIISAVDENKDMYRCPLPIDRCMHIKGRMKVYYGLDYLSDIAAGIEATDKLLFSFGDGLPCAIEYEHDGVKVVYVLAPHIRTD